MQRLSKKKWEPYLAEININGMKMRELCGSSKRMTGEDGEEMKAGR